MDKNTMDKYIALGSFPVYKNPFDWWEYEELLLLETHLASNRPLQDYMPYSIICYIIFYHDIVHTKHSSLSFW